VVRIDVEVQDDNDRKRSMKSSSSSLAGFVISKPRLKANSRTQTLPGYGMLKTPDLTSLLSSEDQVSMPWAFNLAWSGGQALGEGLGVVFKFF